MVGPNPFLGVLYHWIGGLAAASFYIPYRGVQRWAWETYWLVGGVFSWIVAPWVMALAARPGSLGDAAGGAARTLVWAYVFGVLWGLGGLTFGLTVRYLGIALGVAIALGSAPRSARWCRRSSAARSRQIAASTLGTRDPARRGRVPGRHRAQRPGGHVEGARALVGGEAAAVRSSTSAKGMLVATFCGVMSACFAYGLAAGKPLARGHARSAARSEPERALAEPARADRGAARRVHHQLRVVRDPQREEPHGAPVSESAADVQ